MQVVAHITLSAKIVYKYDHRLKQQVGEDIHNQSLEGSRGIT